MIEWGILVEINDNCPIEFKGDLIKLFEERGGNPTVVGVVYVSPSTFTRRRIKYKVKFPDGSYDYLNFDKFDKFFKFSEVEA